MFASGAAKQASSVPGRWWPGALLRLVLPSVLTLLLFSAALFAVILPSVETAFMDRKREMIRELTQSAWDVLAYYHAQEAKGLITREQAQQKAKQQLRAMRYGSEGKDYFWVNDLEPRMVMHPYRPDLEGKNVADFRDPHGKRLFSEVVKVVKATGQGYVDYMWQWKDDPAHVVPKVSFVKEFAPWGWVVGTGIYVEDVAQQMAVITNRLTWASLGIVGIVAVIEFYIILQSLAAERRRRRAEVETQRSRGMLRLVMDNIPQLIFWKDRRGGYLGCNRAFAAHVSLSDPAQIKGLHDHELPRPPAEAPLLQRVEQEVMSTGKAQHHVIEPQQGPGGSTLWMDANRIPLRGPHGRVVGVLCTYEDITRRREMDQALAESERRFRTLVENAQVGIAIVQDGQAVYCNPEARRILGPGETPFALESLGPAGDPRLAKLLELAQAPMSQGGPETEEGQDLDLGFLAGDGHPGGASRWVHCRGGGIVYQGREARLIVMLDITKARELERLVSIQDKMASLGRVAAGIAHEIRNPLSGINLYLTALGGKTQGMAEVTEIVGKMQAASARIEGVIKRVLDFSRPTAPKVSLINLNQVVTNVMELSAVTLRKAGISLEASLAESLPLAHADGQLLEQVLMNLITNAVQALAEVSGEKKIGLDSSLEMDRIVIRVSDSGPGIPPALREKVFDPFYTGRREGSGIGLSLCHRIVSDHGGKLTVSQSRWGGAMFTMELPASAYWGYDSHG
ncbi:MAG: cache domain-containing protein [Desulfarculus sp.]|nr:cache domain-containing protein [Pseudomonadota bacterium]MBU4574260.1 cache domain-containing protein [Pseudomonadota bacterium]MBU4597481.1 cache domain-containing protein [Pseudomonadota bacterium]MBV1718090.1 cache domain-containing protein [Desulfarculus sp.]MBV1737357.1 cache domain-containing protein [Desulfarculus sp.]